MLMIFDWDGTLSDSTAKIVGCVHAAAADLALPRLADQQVRDIIGLSLEQALAQLYPCLAAADLGRLKDAYVAHFTAADATPSAFYPGVMDTLNHLKHAGFVLAVATGKSRKGLARVLANLGMQDYFHATRCADETAGKPDPHMLHELTAYFNCASHEAVMVGDTEFDMAMARSAGMPRIAVSYGAHPIERLRPYQPVLCMDHFAELKAWEPLARLAAERV